MGAVALALASALCWGAGDFLNGSASKRSPVTAVVAVSQGAGLIVLLVTLVVLPGRPDPASILWGAAAGLAGGLALLVFYRCLASGTMSVVAPLTALANAAVPVLVGLALGEHPTPVVWTGVLLAIVGAVLISAEGGRLPRLRRLLAGRTTAGALLAGSLFGLFFVLLSRSAPAAGLWPLAGARIASITLVSLTALLGRRSLRPVRASLPAIAVAGLLDMGANVLFLLSTRLGLLIVTAVLAALYPAATVLLARLVLHERTSRLQAGGFAVAVLSVTCIAIG